MHLLLLLLALHRLLFECLDGSLDQSDNSFQSGGIFCSDIGPAFLYNDVDEFNITFIHLGNQPSHIAIDKFTCNATIVI